MKKKKGRTKNTMITNQLAKWLINWFNQTAHSFERLKSSADNVHMLRLPIIIKCTTTCTASYLPIFGVQRGIGLWSASPQGLAPPNDISGRGVDRSFGTISPNLQHQRSHTSTSNMCALFIFKHYHPAKLHFSPSTCNNWLEIFRLPLDIYLATLVECGRIIVHSL